MKQLEEYLNETIGGGSQLNEAEEVKLQPGMACLIQYVFKNGYKDTKLTNMIYVHDFSKLDPTECNCMEWFTCAGEFTDIDKDIDTIKKDLDKYVKAGDIEVENDRGRIKIKCSVAKVVPLNDGEHVKTAASFVFFNGQWGKLKEMDKIIHSYLMETIKPTKLSVWHV